MASQVDLEGLLSVLFSGSKWRWATGIGLESAAVLCGALAVIFEVNTPWAGSLVALVALSGSGLKSWGDSWRARAEELLRAKELRDGLNWPIDRKRYADLRSDHSSLKSSARHRQEEQESFYDTREEQGPRRLLEMIRESSWWTERLSRRAFGFSLTAVVALVVISLYALPFALLLRTSAAAPEDFVAFYTALICLVFSGDLARIVVGYGSLSSGSSSTCGRLFSLASQREVSEADVVSVVTQYQFTRAASPPIPDWLWRIRRQTLNEIWDEELSTRSRDLT